MGPARRELRACFLISSVFFAASSFGDRLHLSPHRKDSDTQLNHSYVYPDIIQDDGAPTRMFVIETDADARLMANLHATDQNELLFTTYTFTHNGRYSKDAVHMARHLWQNLKEIGRLQNTIIISYDLHSCQVLTEHGIPCFLDRWSRQPGDLPGQYGTDVPHWYAKYAWALRFIEWGYVTVFIETDMYFFADPLPYYNSFNDLEGLSDWRLAEVPGPKDRYKYPCGVYHLQKGNQNDQYLDWGPNRPDDPRSTDHINPCMSTGFWFIQPTQPGREFLEAFIELELYWRNWQTDQRLWNEVIMAFLIGQGKRRPLVFSLLDTVRFSNFEVYDWRQEQDLPTNPVMLHAGAMRGEEKEPYMRRKGYWRAEQWDVMGAAQHTAYLLEHMNRTLPKFGRDHLGDL